VAVVTHHRQIGINEGLDRISVSLHLDNTIPNVTSWIAINLKGQLTLR
jgi:hypothetical protein